MLTLQPDAAAGIDTYVDNVAVDTNFATTSMVVKGGTAKASGLIKFDLSALVGKTINSATLSLFGSGFGVDRTFYIARILAANSAWTEAGATWNYAVASSTRWAGDTGNDGGADAGCSVAGTDYSATVMASALFESDADVETQFSLDLTEFGLLVANNYGLRIGATSGSTVCYAPSSDNVTAARRPKLVVDYEGGSGATVKQMHYARMRH